MKAIKLFMADKKRVNTCISFKNNRCKYALYLDTAAWINSKYLLFKVAFNKTHID